METLEKTKFLEEILINPKYCFGDVSQRAIRHTLLTNYETGFGVFKHISKSKIIYSPKIFVGNENSISLSNGFFRAEEKFKKEYPKFKKLDHLNLLRNEQFKKFLKKKEKFEISLSHQIPKEFSWNYNFHAKKENPAEFYPLISFHTHPNPLVILAPSEEDVFVLDGLTRAVKGDINPISAIAQATNSHICPILLLQQKSHLGREQIEELYARELFYYRPSSLDWILRNRTMLTGLKEKKETLKKFGYNMGYLYLDMFREDSKLEFDCF